MTQTQTRSSRHIKAYTTLENTQKPRMENKAQSVHQNIQTHSLNFQTLVTEISLLRLLQNHKNKPEKQRKTIILLAPPNANIAFLPVQCILDTSLEISPRLPQTAAANLIRYEQQESVQSKIRIFAETIPFPTQRNTKATTLFLYLPPKRNSFNDISTIPNTLASGIELAYAQDHADIIAINHATLLQDVTSLQALTLYCNSKPLPPIIILFGNKDPISNIRNYITKTSPQWEFQPIFMTGLQATTHRLAYLQSNQYQDATKLLASVQQTWKTILHNQYLPPLVRLVGIDFFRCNTDVLIIYAGDTRDLHMQEHFAEYKTWRKQTPNTGEWKPPTEYHQQFPFLPLLIHVLPTPDMHQIRETLQTYYMNNHTIALFPVDIPGTQDYDLLQSTRQIHKMAQSIVTDVHKQEKATRKGNQGTHRTPRWLPRLRPTALTSMGPPPPSRTFPINTRVPAPRRIFLMDMQAVETRSRWAETTGIDMRFIELVMSNTLITMINLFFLLTRE